MLGDTVSMGRGRDDPRIRSERCHPILVAGTRQHGQLEVRTRIKAAQQGAQIGADSEIGELSRIQGQSQNHAAIVALIASASR
jgi:hypothetical protein